MATKKKYNPDSSTGEDTGIKDNTIYETILKPKAIKDKTGWEIRPENRMILKGDLTPANPGNPILPEGFPQPKKGKK